MKKQQRPTGTLAAEPDVTASVIARGTTLVGDCSSEGTIWIEGRVEGRVQSAKAIVIAKDGVVAGDIIAHDAIISGRVQGGVTTASSVELKASCVVAGEIGTRNIAVEKGALVNASFTRSSANAWRGPGLDASRVKADERWTRYMFIAKVLDGTGYHGLRKGEKSKIKVLLQQRTGFSRAQLTRLIAQHRATGKIMDRRR